MSRDAFVTQLNRLKTRTLELGEQVGRTIGESVEALKTRDRVLAEAIITNDQELNRQRYWIEESCYTLIATQQPLAGTLRQIICTLFVAVELERIADHAKNLGEIVIHMGDEPLLKPLIEIPRMSDLCRDMLARAMDAFSRSDTELALAVIQQDDEIDDLYKQIFRELVTYVAGDPRASARALNLLFAAHNLERIGDRITNIGERVIYAVTGQLEELNVGEPLSRHP